jgi:hypothetical protein
MRIRATVTKSGYVAGVEYDVDPGVGMAMIIAGNAVPVAVAQFKDREKAVLPQNYETR